MLFLILEDFMEEELTSEQIKLHCGACVSCARSKLLRSYTKTFVAKIVTDFHLEGKEVGPAIPPKIAAQVC